MKKKQFSSKSDHKQRFLHFDEAVHGGPRKKNPFLLLFYRDACIKKDVIHEFTSSSMLKNTKCLHVQHIPKVSSRYLE